MYDFWGNELKRFYSLETLQQAVERTVHGKDAFLKPSFQQTLGPAPIASIRFDLFQEGRHQFVFRVSCANTKKKRGVFGLLVAKNHQEHSKVAKAEHENLRWLHERLPDRVVAPLRGGTFFLPDRHGRKSHHRLVYAYVTRWFTGHHELGIDKDLRLFINDIPRQRFSVRDSESIKAQMVRTIIASFDPETGQAMALPQIASGDFVATRPGKGPPKVKLIACRRIRRRMTPARLMRDILEASWPWGNRTFYLVPEDADVFVDALVAELGRDEAKRWIDAYADAVERGRYREAPTHSSAVLRQI